VAFADGRDRLRGERRPTLRGFLVDGDEPLGREARLDDGPGALTDGQREGVIFDGYEEAGGFEVGDDALASFEAV